jgi:predicted Zn-dependent protease with MMP-like domain
VAANEDLERVLDAIDVLLTDGDWEGALARADEALPGQGSGASLHHARGLALRGLGRSEEALEAFLTAVDHDAELVDASIDAAEVMIEDLADDAGALQVTQAARRHVSEPGLRAELELLRAHAQAHLGDATGALRTLDEAAKLDPSNPDVPAERGAVLVELLRFEEAEADVRAAVTAEPEHPRALQLLAFVLDYTGRRDEAAEQFRRAAAVDPELPAAPPRLSEEAFDRAVERALKRVPTRFAEHVQNVEISVQNYPDKEFCRREDCGPMTLGIYVGTPMTLREGSESSLPDRIVLFQRSIENACRTEAEVVDEIAVTLRHEIGHLLGMEESDLVDAGYE